MDTSNNIQLRTAIMVISMVVLPLAAVVGVKSPRFLTSWTMANSEFSAKPIGEKPGASTKSRTITPPEQGTTSSLAGRSLNGVDAEGVTRASPDDAFIAEPRALPVSHAVNIDVRSDIPPTIDAHGLDSSAFALPPGVGPFAVPNPYESAGTNGFSGGAEQHSTASATGEHSTFTHIQQRLRSLGAVHYVLETTGSQGTLFRFQCRMATGSGSNYSRYFEATGPDPLLVMRNVLEEVEAWKSGRLP